MLIINYNQIAWYISKELPFPQSILKKAQRIATYYDAEFIDKFFNDDKFLSQQLNITLEEAKEIFTKGLRLYFAVYNISDPLEALKRVKDHLDNTLTDENIAKELNITLEEAKEIFTRGLRLYFAVYHISNPLEALKKWLRNEISTPYDYKREEILKVIENK